MPTYNLSSEAIKSLDEEQRFLIAHKCLKALQIYHEGENLLKLNADNFKISIESGEISVNIEPPILKKSKEEGQDPIQIISQNNSALKILLDKILPKKKDLEHDKKELTAKIASQEKFQKKIGRTLADIEEDINVANKNIKYGIEVMGNLKGYRKQLKDYNTQISKMSPLKKIDFRSKSEYRQLKEERWLVQHYVKHGERISKKLPREKGKLKIYQEKYQTVERAGMQLKKKLDVDKENLGKIKTLESHFQKFEELFNQNILIQKSKEEKIKNAQNEKFKAITSNDFLEHYEKNKGKKEIKPFQKEWADKINQAYSSLSKDEFRAPLHKAKILYILLNQAKGAVARQQDSQSAFGMMGIGFSDLTSSFCRLCEKEQEKLAKEFPELTKIKISSDKNSEYMELLNQGHQITRGFPQPPEKSKPKEKQPEPSEKPKVATKIKQKKL